MLTSQLRHRYRSHPLNGRAGDCSPGFAEGIKVSRSKRLDGAAARPLAPPYGGPTISWTSAGPAYNLRSPASGCSAG